MRSIEKVSLQDYIAQVSDFCTPYTTARRFYSYIDRLGQESLQKVSFENDYEFLKKASTVLNIILSIITHPHIANRREEIVARIEQVKQLNNEEFTRVMKTSQFWKQRGTEMIPEEVYYFQHVDELAIYENKFIVLLTDLLDRELSLYGDFYLTIMPSFKLGEDLTLNDVDSLKVLQMIDLLKRKVSYVKSSHFYKEVSQTPPISKKINKTNILLKDNLYSQCYRFYRKFMSYENEGVMERDFMTFYKVVLLRQFKERGFVLDGTGSFRAKKKWRFFSDLFRVDMELLRDNGGFSFVIRSLKENYVQKHLLCLAAYPLANIAANYSDYDTVDVLSVWDLKPIEKLGGPLTKRKTEDQLVGEWIDSKTSVIPADRALYTRYCPVCKAKGVRDDDNHMTCSRCGTEYVFTTDREDNEAIWFAKIGRLL